MLICVETMNTDSMFPVARKLASGNTSLKVISSPYCALSGFCLRFFVLIRVTRHKMQLLHEVISTSIINTKLYSSFFLMSLDETTL